MSSQWTDKLAIMRDLAQVQGSVPVELWETLGAGDKPLPVKIVEETEEEFFGDCTGDVNFPDPDVRIIAKMLDVVRDLNISSDLEDDSKTTVQETDTSSDEYTNETFHFKVNPLSADFVPRSMFKRKNVTKDIPVKRTLTTSGTVGVGRCQKYVPSTQAEEYYQRYLERSKLSEVENVREDIWSRASKRMKEIDEQRKYEPDLLRDLAMRETSVDFTSIILPQHRHRLTGDCVVCEVLCGKAPKSDVAERL